MCLVVVEVIRGCRKSGEGKQQQRIRLVSCAGHKTAKCSWQ